MQEERKNAQTPENPEERPAEETKPPMEAAQAEERGEPAETEDETGKARQETDGAADPEEEDEASEEEDDTEKLFDVNFDIRPEELYHFQLNMGAQQIEKNRRNSRIVSIVEIVLGIVYLGAIIMGKVPAGIFQLILTVILLGMGVYGLVYYKYFFYSSLRKSVEKQHKKVPYFNAGICLEIYPNKCVEVFEDKRTPNYWRNILGVMAAEDALYIRLDKQHCLLIPKRCAGAELEPFLRKMCGDFEKEWKDA